MISKNLRNIYFTSIHIIMTEENDHFQIFYTIFDLNHLFLINYIPLLFPFHSYFIIFFKLIYSYNVVLSYN